MEQEMKHWLSLKIHQKSLKSFFEINKIGSIAIYGGAVLGNLFYQEVIKYDIKVHCFIDREVTQFNELPVVHPDHLGAVKGVDLIVVCVRFERTGSILELLHKSGFNAITLRRLLEICYYSEIILPFCKTHGVTPFILSWPYNECLQDLSAFEKALSVIQRNGDYYRLNPNYLAEIYTGVSEYGNKYVNDVFTLSPAIRKSNTIVHSDITSEYVNVINGIRLTCYTPTVYQNNIYILGQCVVFGFGVDDSRTIASYLQKRIIDNHSDYRVVNLGVWGMIVDTVYEYAEKLYSLPLKKGDIVVFFSDLFKLNEYKLNIRKYFSSVLSNNYFDLLDNFNISRPSNEPLYIDLAHLSYRGMDRVAKAIFDLLEHGVENCSAQFRGKTDISALEQEAQQQSAVKIPLIIAEEHSEGASSLLENKTLDSYVTFLRPFLKQGHSINGGIVMNCNPFTKGHRHLIETSATKVDFLYIFVVEEDLSVFPFEDRLKLVKLGTEDIKNVIVLPSGRFILSAITFPEYFVKDSLKEVVVDPSKDIEIFAQKIAPVLNIKKRFVAQEPFDMVTRQYNQTMKEILPVYNIELIEIERHGIDGEPISASLVRKLMELNDWNAISKLVPDTTLRYLQEKKENTHCIE